jgi:hypothetical protein
VITESRTSNYLNKLGWRIHEADGSEYCPACALRNGANQLITGDIIKSYQIGAITFIQCQSLNCTNSLIIPLHGPEATPRMEEVNNLNPNTCPECGEREETRCRCRIGDKECKNHHHWAMCKTHGKVSCTQPPNGSYPIPNCPCYQKVQTEGITNSRDPLPYHQRLGSDKHEQKMYDFLCSQTKSAIDYYHGALKSGDDGLLKNASDLLGRIRRVHGKYIDDHYKDVQALRTAKERFSHYAQADHHKQVSDFLQKLEDHVNRMRGIQVKVEDIATGLEAHLRHLFEGSNRSQRVGERVARHIGRATGKYEKKPGAKMVPDPDKVIARKSVGLSGKKFGRFHGQQMSDSKQKLVLAAQFLKDNYNKDEQELATLVKTFPYKHELTSIVDHMIATTLGGWKKEGTQLVNETEHIANPNNWIFNEDGTIITRNRKKLSSIDNLLVIKRLNEASSPQRQQEFINNSPSIQGKTMSKEEHDRIIADALSFIDWTIEPAGNKDINRRKLEVVDNLRCIMFINKFQLSTDR